MPSQFEPKPPMCAIVSLWRWYNKSVRSEGKRHKSDEPDRPLNHTAICLKLSDDGHDEAGGNKERQMLNILVAFGVPAVILAVIFVAKSRSDKTRGY